MTLLLWFLRHCRCVNLAGHSAGAHLLVSMMNHLVNQSSIYLHLVNVIYPIAGAFDLTELRYTKVANNNNLLSLTDQNVQRLSPMFYDYSKWKDVTFRIKFITAEHDAPKLIQHSNQLCDILNGFLLVASCQTIALSNVDHFNVVTELAHKDFKLTKILTDDLQQ